MLIEGKKKNEILLSNVLIKVSSKSCLSDREIIFFPFTSETPSRSNILVIL